MFDNPKIFGKELELLSVANKLLREHQGICFMFFYGYFGMNAFWRIVTGQGKTNFRSWMTSSGLYFLSPSSRDNKATSFHTYCARKPYAFSIFVLFCEDRKCNDIQFGWKCTLEFFTRFFINYSSYKYLMILISRLAYCVPTRVIPLREMHDWKFELSWLSFRHQSVWNRHQAALVSFDVLNTKLEDEYVRTKSQLYKHY